MNMPWEKNFNEEQVLELAMNAFWKKGYASTSIQDLLTTMGIQRGSFYDTFKDKHTLFVLALQKYKEQFEYWFSQIESKLPPKEAIINVFTSVIEDAENSENYNGCFIVNTSLELAIHDQEITKLVEEGFSLTESFFYRMIKKGHADGSINKNLSPSNTARVLIGLMAGIRVLSRGRSDLSAAKALVAHAKSILN